MSKFTRFWNRYCCVQFGWTALDTWAPPELAAFCCFSGRCVYFLAKQGSKLRLVQGFLHTQARLRGQAGDDLLLPTVNQFPPCLTRHYSHHQLVISDPISSHPPPSDKKQHRHRRSLPCTRIKPCWAKWKTTFFCVMASLSSKLSYK